MILCCSAGCSCDMSKFAQSPGAGWMLQHSGWNNKKLGDKCPEACWNGVGLGTNYCGRRLFDLDVRVEELYGKLFSRRLSGNDKRLDTHNLIYAHRGIDIRAELRRLILAGKKPVTGYFCTAIRESHNRVILSLP
jgi:hypothetical protein